MPRRNVLFFAMDDLRPELACYGAGEVSSPNIDRLAAAGLLFRRAYCQQAVCAPSRTSLLTGMRPDTTGIHDLEHPLRDTVPDALSMPQHFRLNGYETVSLGKVYHHKRDDNGVGWSADTWHPTGPWKGLGYLTPEAQAEVQPGTGRRSGLGPAFESADVPNEAYPDGATAARAVSELRRLKRSGKPFFLAVGFAKPDLPFNAPRRCWNRYRRDRMVLPERQKWPSGAPECALSDWKELRSYVGLPKQGPVPDDLARELIHGYRACVSYTDSLVGRVVAELDRIGLRENTVVILWGDNGCKLGEYGAWSKHTNFELDARVPLILSAPGQPNAGRSTEALVELVDIFPTLCELCGLDIPPSCEGTSMAPLLGDPDRAWKKAAFSQYPRDLLMGYSIRCGPWRYTEWIDRATREVRERELYDHSTSLVADANLAGRPESAPTVARLSEVLDKGQGWKALRPSP